MTQWNHVSHELNGASSDLNAAATGGKITSPTGVGWAVHPQPPD